MAGRGRAGRNRPVRDSPRPHHERICGVPSRKSALAIASRVCAGSDAPRNVGAIRLGFHRMAIWKLEHEHAPRVYHLRFTSWILILVHSHRMKNIAQPFRAWTRRTGRSESRRDGRTPRSRQNLFRPCGTKASSRSSPSPEGLGYFQTSNESLRNRRRPFHRLLRKLPRFLRAAQQAI